MYPAATRISENGITKSGQSLKLAACQSGWSGALV